MNVFDITNLKVLKDCKVIAGKSGLSNLITNTTLVDAPDGFKWCRKGDFIISTGFPFTENQVWNVGMLKFLEVLVDKRCSGLGIKLGRYVPYLTKEIISFANENNFPIISIPHRVKWADIIVPTVREINTMNQHKLEMNQDVYLKFHNYLKEREDLPKLAELLQNIIDCPVTIYIRGLNKKIDSGKSSFSTEDIEDIITTFSYGRNQTMHHINMMNTAFTVRWISNSDKNKLEGGIFLWDPPKRLETWEKIALEQVAVITALEIEKQRSIVTAYQRFRNDLLTKLINKNSFSSEALKRRLKRVDWNIGEKNRAILLDCDLNNNNNGRPLWRIKADILEEFENDLNRSSFENIPLGFDTNSRFLFLIPEYVNKKAIINTITKTVNKLNITTFYGGIGSLKTVDNLFKSYNESKISLNVSRSISPVHIPKKQTNKLFMQNIEDLHVERILFAENPREESRRFAEHLHKVIEYDEDKKGELMTTLKAFLANNSNFDDTAKALFIHKNTARYRINMIQDLTNLDPRKIEDQLILHIALTVLQTDPMSSSVAT